jgi:hypothetical protein
MTDTQRKKHLRYLVTESVRMLKEQDIGMPGAPVSAVPPPAPPPPDVTMTPQPGADGTQGPQGAKPFTVDEMIERLNVIRSGKSFSDPEVYGQLTSYFKGVSEPDKAVIDKFLQGLGRVVIQVDAVEQGSQAGGQPPPPPPAAPTPGPAPAPAGGMGMG